MKTVRNIDEIKYRFSYNGNDKIENLIIFYSKKPSVSQVKSEINIIKSRFIAGCDINTFKPKKCVIYPAIHGWDKFYVAHIRDSEFIDIDRAFYDETIGKRKIFNF